MGLVCPFQKYVYSSMRIFVVYNFNVYYKACSIIIHSRCDCGDWTARCIGFRLIARYSNLLICAFVRYRAPLHQGVSIAMFYKKSY